MERHLAAKVGTVRILYGVGTISLQAAVRPKCMLGALNINEEPLGVSGQPRAHHPDGHTPAATTQEAVWASKPMSTQRR